MLMNVSKIEASAVPHFRNCVHKLEQWSCKEATYKHLKQNHWQYYPERSYLFVYIGQLCLLFEMDLFL